MKTTNNKLNFKKSSITELNDNQLHNVKGGVYSIIPLTSNITTITNFSRNTFCNSDMK